ncbi:MAG: hypothetical protein LUQ11_13900 [Methylococcaceae bacterium]|nr:hypothetical protein [Methylococcaceae bacterium]
MYERYVKQKIETGLNAIEEGRVVNHEEAKENLLGEDEMAYLLKNPVNSERLLTAINNIEQPQYIVRVDLSEL